MSKTIKCKELCLSDFGIHKVCYHGGTTYDATKGKQQTNIGYMKRGSCIFSTAFTAVECHAGDLVYLPEGTRYSSVSTGEPDVEYYVVHLSFRTDKQGIRFEIQKQAPIGDQTAYETYELGEGESKARNTYLGRSVMLCDFDDRKTQMGMRLLLDALTHFSNRHWLFFLRLLWAGFWLLLRRIRLYWLLAVFEYGQKVEVNRL